MIKRELVEEERWVESSRFNRLLAIYQVSHSNRLAPVRPQGWAPDLRRCVHGNPFRARRRRWRGWRLSEGQFLDGFALSGILPAPLIIFATSVGYRPPAFSLLLSRSRCSSTNSSSGSRAARAQGALQFNGLAWNVMSAENSNRPVFECR